MLLEIEGLDVRYGRNHAVKALDLTVGEGEIVTVLGANGAGKSSLLKAVQGTVKPAGGSEQGEAPNANDLIRTEGRPLEEIEREAIVRALHRFNGHRQKTARSLGIGVRTLGLKLKKWKELRLVEETL